MGKRFHMKHNVLELLEESAEKYPDKVGFGDAESDMTFGELQSKARRIGAVLADRISIGDPVAFYMEKSNLALCGMFGAVYAGGFYSFLDVRQPMERIQSILRTLQPKVLLTNRENWEKAVSIAKAYGDCPVLCLEETGASGEGRLEKLQQIRRESRDTLPLYVNFTSGSTGVPKGVTVSHRSVLEFIDVFVDTFGIGENDIFGNQAPFDFDVSVKDIYGGLAAGAKVQLIPRNYFSSPMQLMDYLADHRVTVLVWAVSAMCFVSVMNGFEYRVPETVRKVMFSGEILPVKHLKVWKQYLPKAEFVNLYGPTEITCNCTYHILKEEEENSSGIPIGKAFPNEKVFLLDAADREVTESGKEGEICVGGTCLALGYYHDPERTSQVFVQNPLNGNYRELIYRTGDIGKYNDAGELVYVSRKDFQIKHLGHRIELGEIEAVVMGCEGITRSCCTYDKVRQRLHLFYTGDREKRDLMREIRKKLPPFMLPNQIFPLKEMPLNKNGKIDRNALEAMAGGKEREAD